MARFDCIFRDKLSGAIRRLFPLSTDTPDEVGDAGKLSSPRIMSDDRGRRCCVAQDRFSVQFKAMDASAIDRAAAREGSAVVEHHRTPGYVSLAVPAHERLGPTIQRFVEMNQVSFAEPDYFQPPDEGRRRDRPRNENGAELFSKQWNLHNSGGRISKSPGRPGADISAPRAWPISKGSRDVVIVVIDKGFDLEHPVLRENQYPRGSDNWNFQSDDKRSPQGGEPHGNHVLGVACADESSRGIVGVAPRCRFIPLRVRLDGFHPQRVDALEWVARKAASQPEKRFIVNCSWGMNADVSGVRNAIGQASGEGNVLFIASAGNDNLDLSSSKPVYPAGYSEVVSVAATDHRDRKWLENDGIGSNFGRVDVCAPGYAIPTTTGKGGYTLADGTSIAAPHAAGVAALVWSVAPGLPPGRVRQILEETCDGIDHLNPAFAGKLGVGRVNAFRAVKRARDAERLEGGSP